MSDTEIFEKLIEKVKDKYTVTLGDASIEQFIQYKIYYKIIFDHEFAKALWGDMFLSKKTLKPLVLKVTRGKKLFVSNDDFILEYELRLQEMVIADDYLQYLSQFC